ncbi:hypothetical protein CUU66_15580 [Peribacillus deserti]|uniref:Uncharacterized protein n=1 Tax=Peribacillus deserti TaxID=673318 RepID=A0A2N5M414_9BACI|nr:hypothetical protein CUU66_15580 [Peribacillus deserti]
MKVYAYLLGFYAYLFKVYADLLKINALCFLPYAYSAALMLMNPALMLIPPKDAAESKRAMSFRSSSSRIDLP